MKLSARTFERLYQADPRFARLESNFNSFANELEYFKNPSCPLKGVKIEASPYYLVINYKTVALGIRLILKLSEDNTPYAKVSVSQIIAQQANPQEELGTFTFNPQGITDFEPDDQGDPVDLDGKALEIVVHFLHLALSK